MPSDEKAQKDVSPESEPKPGKENEQLEQTKAQLFRTADTLEDVRQDLGFVLEQKHDLERRCRDLASELAACKVRLEKSLSLNAEIEAMDRQPGKRGSVFYTALFIILKHRVLQEISQTQEATENAVSSAAAAKYKCDVGTVTVLKDVSKPVGYSRTQPLISAATAPAEVMTKAKKGEDTLMKTVASTVSEACQTDPEPALTQQPKWAKEIGDDEIALVRQPTEFSITLQQQLRPTSSPSVRPADSLGQPQPPVQTRQWTQASDKCLDPASDELLRSELVQFRAGRPGHSRNGNSRSNRSMLIPGSGNLGAKDTAVDEKKYQQAVKYICSQNKDELAEFFAWKRVQSAAPRYLLPKLQTSIVTNRAKSTEDCGTTPRANRPSQILY